jgi:predicted nuclease of restriction endonuclease-like (RecB) superfamily
MSDHLPITAGFEQIYERIRSILAEARAQVHRAINTAMVAAYWEIGRTIVEEEQRGGQRAEYGRALLADLSIRLKSEFGKGFDPSNLSMMRALFLTYPIFDAVRQELSWTHYRLLLRVENPDARSFYENEAINAHWSTRELERQIHSLLFERLALSRDREGVLALAQKGHVIQQPNDLVKDPYILEFVGISQNERFLESGIEQALIGKLREFLLELGKGFAFMARPQRQAIELSARLGD